MRPRIHGVQEAVWALARERNLPILGICYGFQELTHTLGGKVERAPRREFGHAVVTRKPAAPTTGDGTLLDALLRDLPDTFTVGGPLRFKAVVGVITTKP